MKKSTQAFVIICFYVVATANRATAMLCDIRNTSFEKEFHQTLSFMPKTLFTLEATGKKQVYIAESDKGLLKMKKSLPEDVPLKDGQIIETGKKSELKISFFIPVKHTFIIAENSQIEIIKNPNDKCGAVIKVLKGKMTAESTSTDKQPLVKIEADGLKNTQICSKEGEVHTQNVMIRPVGTKYSVDLSEAINESSGGITKVETYEVEEGKILIRPKKSKESFAVKIRKIKSKNAKFKKEDRRNDALSEEEFNKRLSQFILEANKKSSKKAKLKRNKRSKEASVEIIPVD